MENKKIAMTDLKNMSVEEIRSQLGGTKVHAVSIQKGGTGKTLTTSDLGYKLAQMGFKVLLIDADPQASLSMLCGIDIADLEVKGLQNIYDDYLNQYGEISFDDLKEYLGFKPTFEKPVIRNGKAETKKVEFGFDLIPCNIILSNYELTLSNTKKGVYILYNILKLIKKNTDYDFILIDCPPGLGFITFSALAAAVDGIIVPVNLEVVTLLGAKNLIDSVAQVQKYIRGEKDAIHKGILGIVKNKYTPRYTIQKEFAEIVDQFFPIPTFKTSIPNKTACDTAHSLGRLYSEYDSVAGKAFEALAWEVVQKDIQRSAETETVIIEEFGEEVRDMVNKQKKEKLRQKQLKNAKKKEEKKKGGDEK